MFFFRSGDIWFIKFQGKRATIKDSKRLRYVVYLIEYPNRGFWAHELMSYVEMQNPETSPYYGMKERPLQTIGLSLVDLSIENLSKDEKDKLEDAVYKAWEALNDSEFKDNRQKKLKAEKEWSGIKKFLLQEYGVQVTESQKYGLSFTLRPRLMKEAEKARTNVTKHISNALKSIKKEIPSCYYHLRECIETGKICKYNPRLEQVVEWHIHW